MEENGTNDQKNKKKNGDSLRRTVEIILHLLKEARLITDFQGEGTTSENSPHFGYPGKYEKQFRCDYTYTLDGDTEIILHTMSSYDSGRFTAKEWDSFHIKKINKKIKKSFVLYPDELEKKKKHSFASIINKLKNKEVISYIDGIYSQTEFLYLLEDEVLGKELNGSRAAKAGTIFELIFAYTMSLEQNFELWKKESAAGIGWNFDLYKKTLDYLSISPQNVKRIHATRDIKVLPEYIYSDGTKKRGGKPKTDVVLYVEYEDGTGNYYTFSCKNTSQKQVHVNQFSAKYVVDLLKMEPAKEIEELLELYRTDGGPTNFKKNHPNEYEQLQVLIVPYVDAFERWCLSGDFREGSNDLQIATHIISCHMQSDGKEIYDIIDIDSYLHKMRATGKKTFGTIFSWTVTKTDVHGMNEIRVKAKL